MVGRHVGWLWIAPQHSGLTLARAACGYGIASLAAVHESLLSEAPAMTSAEGTRMLLLSGCACARHHPPCATQVSHRIEVAITALIAVEILLSIYFHIFH
jgi:hypothetical protein